MPIAKIQLPDGRVAKLEVPEGATNEQISAFAKQQWDAGAFGTAPQAAPEAAQAAEQAPQADALAQRRAATRGVQTAGQIKSGLAGEMVGAGAGAMNALREVGQAVVDWTSWGLDKVGLEDAAESVAKYGNSIEEKEALRDQVRVQMANNLHESLFGGPVTHPEQLKKNLNMSKEIVKDAALVGTAMAGGAATLGAKTFMGTVGLATTEGALSGALLNESNAKTVEERMADRTFGALIGAGASGLVGVGQGLFTSTRNYLAKNIQEHVQDASHNFKLADEFDMDITLGQATGNPVIANLETQAAKKTAQETFAQQTEDAGKRIAEKIGLPVRPLGQVGYGQGAALDDMVKAVDTKIRGMKVARSQAWREGIAEATEASAGAPIMKTGGFADDVQKVIDEIDHDFNGLFKPSQGLKDLLAEARLGEQQGWTAAQINKWWRRVNEYKKGAGLFGEAVEGVDLKDYKKFGQVFAGRLSGSLDESVRKAAALADDGPTAGALRALGRARDDYKAATGNIKMLEDDFLTGLGVKGGPTEVLDRLSKMDAMQVRKVANHIRSLDGGEIYLSQLQDAVYDAALQKGSHAAAQMGSKRGGVFLPAFADALADGSQRSVLMGISDPGVARNAEKGVELMRVLLNASEQAMPGGVAVTQLPLSMQDVAINAISRSPEFIARTFAGAVARGHNMESLFFTKEGIKALRAFHPEAIKYGGMSAMRNALIVKMGLETGDHAKHEADAMWQQQNGGQ